MTQENLNKHSLNLWQKLAAITKEVGYIEKTGENGHFHYKFMEHAQVVAVIRPILEEYGVTVDLEALDATFSEKNRVLLHMSYTVTNADKPSETFTRRWVSEAMDQQDKGINKALTAAEKNVFAKLFHISDQDLEADENDQQQPAAKKQQQPRQQPANPAPGRPQPTQPAQTSNRPAPASTPARTAPGAPGPTPQQQPQAVTQPAAPIVSGNDEPFKVYAAKIQAAKTLTDLKKVEAEIKANVSNRAVLMALRAEYNKRENVLIDIANAQADGFVGSVK